MTTGIEAKCTHSTTMRTVSSRARSSEKQLTWVAGMLGLFCFVVILSAYHIADGDLWAKLAIGASVWLRGHLPDQDSFAFTPILPRYIDHEWGAGTLFYGLLSCCGPRALMALKIILFLGAVLIALVLARRNGVSWSTALFLALPAAWTVVPAYVPTLRAHTFTFFFFAALLLALERLRDGERKAAFVVPVLMWIWANVHGGVAAGFGTIAIYSAEAWIRRRATRVTMPLVATVSLIVTLINPYGFDYWRYLVPALLHPRPRIAEWQPLAIWEIDFYLGFRILCLIVAASLLLGWRAVQSKSPSGLAMLVITGFLGWRSQRHAPFFGIAALAFTGPFLEAAIARMIQWISLPFRWKIRSIAFVTALYAIVAIFVAVKFVPDASWEILAPLGHDPVRETDILSRAQVSGNLAVPFGWGSYASWRLYPNIKISHDGRYEAAYPESTFQLNNDFFEKRGTNWDRLIREWSVDFVVLDLEHERLQPEDLQPHGYELIWEEANVSALVALPKHASALRKSAVELPPETINPLNAAIPRRWFAK